MRIREATQADAHAIARIYNHYIRSTVITFELVELRAQEVANRIAKVKQAGLPYLVAESGGGVVGYAFTGPFKERAAYVHSVETSVYVAHDEVGAGIGKALFTELFAQLRGLSQRESPHAPIHAIIGGIALPNEASVALHESFGMTKVAHFPEVGFKLGRWVDVGYWQLTLADEAGS